MSNDTFSKPLAFRLRPKSIKDIIGQYHLLGDNGVLTRIVEHKSPINLIFYGYPGVGKTTAAIALCNDIKFPYDVFNAAVDKKETLLEFVKVSKQLNNKYILIVEEIHRLNKDKQDILLPYLEDGTITMIACTTENPYHEINPAIRSRCSIVRFNQVTSDELCLWLTKLIKNNVIDNVDIPKKIIEMISIKVNGDVRSAINILDTIQKLYPNEKITLEKLDSICSEAYILTSSYGDEHYDLLSAFHKSLRGSDPDAAIHYLARLVISKDLASVTRRMIACAYEDIGLANTPLCARVVTSCLACEKIGFPECHQILATTVIEMCLSPKSNSAYKAFYQATDDIKNGKGFEIPKHLKDNNYASSAKLGNVGYVYPHDFKHHYINQQYLPNKLKNAKYYIKASNPNETNLNAYLEEIKQKINK